MAKVIGGRPSFLSASITFFSARAVSGRSCMAAGSAQSMRAYRSFETVMPLPFRSMLNAVMVAVGGAPRPRVAAIGMPASMCAPSSAPAASLSRMLAHEASFDTLLLRPYLLK